MKTAVGFLIILICNASISGAETISLDVQGCQTYWENGSALFQCAPQHNINLELKDVGSGSQAGFWSETVRMGQTSFNVSLDIRKLRMPNGAVISSISGTIRQSDDVPLAAVSGDLTDNFSISLASLVPYGEKQAAPHFFFATPLAFNPARNALIMERAAVERFKPR